MGEGRFFFLSEYNSERIWKGLMLYNFLTIFLCYHVNV